MKYRIKKDKHNYYSWEYKHWYLPFWISYPEPSHDTFEAAKNSMERFIEERENYKKSKEIIVWTSYKK